MMLTQNGKLLYISDNAAEYLGHSMEDLLIHGDSVYDIIDKQDYNAIQTELNRTGSHIHQSSSLHSLHHHNSVNMDGEKRMFLCRMNVSRWLKTIIIIISHNSLINFPFLSTEMLDDKCASVTRKLFSYRVTISHIFRFVVEMSQSSSLLVRP